MLYLLQREKVHSHVINVPEGLSDILMDITREVLRCQPYADCFCQFIADLLHSKVAKNKTERIFCEHNLKSLGFMPIFEKNVKKIANIPVQPQKFSSYSVFDEHSETENMQNAKHKDNIYQ
uniref:Uncharacterized protein n=1 Tax=Glossina austeni TaxID=7395 RepID=A0A1A9VDA6_GLOAU